MASRLLFGSVIALPVLIISLGIWVFSIDIIDEEGLLALSGIIPLLLAVFTQFAHKLRKEAVAEDRKGYWENLI